MVLRGLEFEFEEVSVPPDLADLIHEAEGRIDALMEKHPAELGGFVPCDFSWAYSGLFHLNELGLAAGREFCEWGSGVGIVAMLAQRLGWRACGIEIESLLVDAAEDLARRHDIAVEFIDGSFVPRGLDADLERISAELDGGTFWMATESDDSYDRLEKEPSDFDVVFAYPWPGEGDLIEMVFDRSAAVGALLLTFDQFRAMKLQRKVS